MQFSSRYTISDSIRTRVIMLVAVGGLTACAPKKQPTPASTATEQPVATAPQDLAEPAPKKDEEPKEMDWDARLKELELGLHEVFRPVRVGQKMKVILKSRKAHLGKILELDPDSVLLEVRSGSVRFQRESLSVETRVKLFKEDFVVLGARQLLAQEQADAEGRVLLEPTPEPAVLVRTRATPETSSTVSGETTPVERDALREAVDGRVRSSVEVTPVNEGPTGRVKQAEEYIRKNVRNESSLMFLKWGKVHRRDGGWAVEVKYSAKSSSLGRTTSNVLVLMRKNGKAYRQVAIHGGLR